MRPRGQNFSHQFPVVWSPLTHQAPWAPTEQRSTSVSHHSVPSACAVQDSNEEITNFSREGKFKNNVGKLHTRKLCSNSESASSVLCLDPLDGDALPPADLWDSAFQGLTPPTLAKKTYLTLWTQPQTDFRSPVAFCTANNIQNNKRIVLLFSRQFLRETRVFLLNAGTSHSESKRFSRHWRLKGLVKPFTTCYT